MRRTYPQGSGRSHIGEKERPEAAAAADGAPKNRRSAAARTTTPPRGVRNSRRPRLHATPIGRRLPRDCSKSCHQRAIQPPNCLLCRGGDGDCRGRRPRQTPACRRRPLIATSRRGFRCPAENAAPPRPTCCLLPLAPPKTSAVSVRHKHVHPTSRINWPLTALRRQQLSRPRPPAVVAETPAPPAAAARRHQ